MEAARILNLTVYGVDGDATVTFPDVAHALRDGTQADVDLAVARVRTSLERTSNLIR